MNDNKQQQQQQQRKRRRRDDTGDSNDLEESEKANQDEKLQLEDNHSKRTRAMMDYYSKLQDFHKDAERVEGTRKRKAKANAFAATAMAIGAAAANGDDSVSGDKNAAVNDKPPAAGPQRRLWVKNRSKDWWDQCNSPDFPEEEFKKAFRMGKDTFDMICNELSSVVAKENTMLRDAVPERFNAKYLRWPEEESVRRIKEEFESMSGIPNVVGSMYTTHIPIIAPKISVAAYFNRRHTERNQKTSYSITVQGVVDPRGVFTDVCIGYPGSMPDDQVLEKSTLFQRANAGFYQGVWIVGGSGYPLMDWVLVPYTQQHLTWTQHAFNEKIGEIQGIAKESFARLKGRWACLQKRTEVKLQDLPVVLGACCVLHNICELRNENLDASMKFELIDDEMVPEIGLRSANAMKARDAIAHNLLHHNHAGTSFLS
ncbi:hypothetical protein DH2020_025530 [Rehmannia glutinosa]|uniref:DDE Tnp4 domain-containing protein n=1 Tax=Rehmannia glutinosa TaxID=99300 RepID=A0ABR0VZH5_REHGL